MNASRVVTLGVILVSLVLVPGGLAYALLAHGPPEGGGSETVFGLFAMLPGFLMGAAALWVAARG